MAVETMKQSALFAGIEDGDLERLAGCLAPVFKTYGKNELICSAGEESTQLAFIISGGVRLYTENFGGETDLAATLSDGGMFGDICAGAEKSEMTARAASFAQIMFIEYEKLIGVCRSACPSHIKALGNLLRLVAQESIARREKLLILQKRSIREKLLAYLHLHSKRAGSLKFSIPLNRAALADYLRVDRSAMSRELCAMRDDGVLEFYKNSFILMSEDD